MRFVVVVVVVVVVVCLFVCVFVLVVVGFFKPPTGRPFCHRGNGMFILNVHKDLIRACCAHEGEADADESAKLLAQKIEESPLTLPRPAVYSTL